MELARQTLRSLSVRTFRNLAEVDLEPGAALNVLSGPNGAGKTSLLEALYFLATSRSFRSPKARDAVAHGADTGVVRGRFERSLEGRTLVREQRATARRGPSDVRVDDARPESLAAYALRTPVVLFHPGELELTTGAAAGRRLLLDRVALHQDPTSGDHRARHREALRQRQEILRTGRLDGAELEAFEELAAIHGAAVSRARERASGVLVGELGAAFRDLGAPGLALEARYVPRGAVDPQDAAAALKAVRARDAGRPTSSFGPHRDDLAIDLDGRPARVVASQGQHRALTLALKAAESRAIAEASGTLPIWLLDDVSSELDPERLAALFTFLASGVHQLFVTTTRPEILDPVTRSGGLERVDFEVRGGAIRSASRGT